MNTESLIQAVVAELSRVGGVQAVVLGGSRARGTHTPSSDIDLGIYYDQRHPLDIRALGETAARLDDGHGTDLVTPVGGWGPWINGGGWLRIQSQPVDFLYRDLDKVKRVISDCLHGTIEIFYQPGHPHGFPTTIYLGEVAVCRPLWDPGGVLGELKKMVHPYPDSLQKAVIQKFSWEIDFSVEIAKKSIERADAAYASGCCFRGLMCMLQVLFALNREYWLNEKGAVKIAGNFKIKPARLQSRVDEMFRVLAADSGAILDAIDILKELSRDTDTLRQNRSF